MINRGSKHFRDLVGEYKKVYSESDMRIAKSGIVWHTIREVKMKNGRFVEKVTERNPRDGGGAVY
jgi:phage FluMu gp28-like protein